MLFRVLNGFRYAFVCALGITIAAHSLPKEKLSSGLGVFGVSTAIATAVARSAFFIALSAVLLVSRPVCGNLSDRLDAAKGMPMLLTAAVLAGIGHGAANPTLQSIIMQTEPGERSAVASNTMYIGIDIGFFLGPLIGGFIREYVPYRMVMLFGTVPARLAVVLFLLMWRRAAQRLEAVKCMETDRAEQ